MWTIRLPVFPPAAQGQTGTRLGIIPAPSSPRERSRKGVRIGVSYVLVLVSTPEPVKVIGLNFQGSAMRPVCGVW